MKKFLSVFKHILVPGHTLQYMQFLLVQQAFDHTVTIYTMFSMFQTRGEWMVCKHTRRQKGRGNIHRAGTHQ